LAKLLRAGCSSVKLHFSADPATKVVPINVSAGSPPRFPAFTNSFFAAGPGEIAFKAPTVPQFLSGQRGGSILRLQAAHTGQQGNSWAPLCLTMRLVLFWFNSIPGKIFCMDHSGPSTPVALGELRRKTKALLFWPSGPIGFSIFRIALLRQF